MDFFFKKGTMMKEESRDGGGLEENCNHTEHV